MCLPDADTSAVLRSFEKQQGQSLYVVGGAVRDLLLNRPSGDLDLVVRENPQAWAKALVDLLGGGTVVVLSEKTGEEAVRVIWRQLQFDFAAFRKGATTLQQDLGLRDFSINAMALPFQHYLDKNRSGLIDPYGGAADLGRRKLRHLPGAFAADPLRMLRGYRLASRFEFVLADLTRVAVKKQAAAILQVAEERRSYELCQIFSSGHTFETVALMAEDNLLRYLLPELYLCEEVSQPKEFHHLPVLEHCFLALEQIENILSFPERYFADTSLLAEVKSYIARPGTASVLKWAALLHDIGKPETRRECPDRGRTTFHGHDRVGCDLFEAFARRSCWSGAQLQRVSHLIGMHMHPFHLVNLNKDGGVSKKAALRFCNKAGDDFVGLFLLALSDCLAGNPKYHRQIKKELQSLFALLEKTRRHELLPVITGVPLLRGQDLIALGFSPGPVFTTIFSALKEAQVEGFVTDRKSALAWVRKYFGEDMAKNGGGDRLCVK